MMQTSILLAKVFGLLGLLAGAYMLTRREDIVRIYRRFVENHAVLRAGGFFEVTVGLFIVFSHPVFSGWPTVITLLGVAAIAEGLFYLFAARDRVEAVYDDFLNSSAYHITALLVLALGAYLAYAGFVL